MQALVSRCWRADWPAQHLHAGDVDWWSVHAFGRTPGLNERIRLWFAAEADATELVGFAWYGPPNEADLVVAPDSRGSPLIGSMVDWVESQIPQVRIDPHDPARRTRCGRDRGDARGRSRGSSGPGRRARRALGARIWTVAEDEASVQAQVELGFAEGPEPGFVHLTGRLDELDLTAPALPDGYDDRDDRDRGRRRRARRGRPRRVSRLDDDRGEVRRSVVRRRSTARRSTRSCAGRTGRWSRSRWAGSTRSPAASSSSPSASSRIIIAAASAGPSAGPPCGRPSRSADSEVVIARRTDEPGSGGSVFVARSRDHAPGSRLHRSGVTA